jgi:hypothetical protein
MFFDLVRFYALQYKPGEVNSQYGIPVVLTPSGGGRVTSSIGRNTVEEVYNQIIADLTTAVSKLPVDNGIYADRGAANALLARVYLQKGDYAKARDAANDVIIFRVNMNFFLSTKTYLIMMKTHLRIYLQPRLPRRIFRFYDRILFNP